MKSKGMINNPGSAYMHCSSWQLTHQFLAVEKSESRNINPYEVENLILSFIKAKNYFTSLAQIHSSFILIKSPQLHSEVVQLGIVAWGANSIKVIGTGR